VTSEEALKHLEQLLAVVDAAREALRHMERHGSTIAGRKLREALEKLEGREE